MSGFDFSDLPSSFGNQRDLPMARHLGATFTNGIGVDKGWERRRITTAAVFPLSPKELEGFEEGQRVSAGVRIYVTSELELARGDGTSAPKKGDVIEWSGAVWQVAAVSDWSEAGGFWEVAALKMDRPETTIAAFIAGEVGG